MCSHPADKTLGEKHVQQDPRCSSDSVPQVSCILQVCIFLSVGLHGAQSTDDCCWPTASLVTLAVKKLENQKSWCKQCLSTVARAKLWEDSLSTPRRSSIQRQPQDRGHQKRQLFNLFKYGANHLGTDKRSLDLQEGLMLNIGLFFSHAILYTALGN